MKPSPRQLDLPQHAASMAEHLRDLGIATVVCDDCGAIESWTARGDDWLEELFHQAPLFRRVIAEAAPKWSETRSPAPSELLPGLWVVPMPMLTRRRCTGYRLAVVPTDALLKSEHLVAMCNGAGLDVQLTIGLLAKLPPVPEREVGRLISLVSYLHATECRVGDDKITMDTIGQQLAESYEEINLLYSTIARMTVEQRPEEFVQTSCEELLETLPYGWVGSLLMEDEDNLLLLSDQFLMAGEGGVDRNMLAATAKKLAGVIDTSCAMVLNDVTDPTNEAYAVFGSGTIIQPVASESRFMGLLIAGDKQGDDAEASSVDMKLLSATASHMAIFLENAALYEDLNAMFLGTLEALTASIDAKDRYTCGHSERVAHLTEELARAVGLDDKTAHRMRIAGLVHDVGKIGVPEAVLTKPGRLTDDEFAEIRKHPEMGHRILKDIPQLKDLLPGVLYHHERWDGKGYPHNLAGEDIPRIARLIALADSFDAMSSNRTYRSRLSRSDVLEEIRKCAGSQFDPDLAPVFVDLDFSEFDRLVAEHQAGDPPARSTKEEAA